MEMKMVSATAGSIWTRGARCGRSPRSPRWGRSLRSEYVVTVLGEETDADGALWYQIRTEGGREGYIRGDLLAVE